MRRAVAVLLLALLVVTGTGCGGHHKQTSSALDDALGYFSKDAPFVMAVETDPNGTQLKQMAQLAGRFPGSDLLVNRILSFSRFRYVDWSRDVRPQLGAPLVVGLLRPAAGKDVATATVFAMRLQHPVRAKRVILRQPGFRGHGKESGVRIYENTFENRYLAVDGRTLVGATDRGILAQALALKREDNRMRASDFKRDLAGLPAGGLARISADPRTMLGADARLRPALDVKWIASMRRLGAVVKAGDDGLTLDLHLATDPSTLKGSDLPLTPAKRPLPLIGNRGEVQIGVRGPDRLARLAFSFWRAVAPKAEQKFRALEPRGVDLEQQIPHHLADTALVAFDPLSKDFALRSSLHEPADVRDSFAVVSPALPDLAAALGMKGLGVASPAPGERFYALAKTNGRSAVFGVVGNSLVAASLAQRAAGLVSERTHTVPGASGSAVVTLNARDLAARLIAQRLKGAAALFAPLAVASLRDLTGGLTISRKGLDGHFKLTIVK